MSVVPIAPRGYAHVQGLAQTVRIERARLKRMLKAGTLTLEEAFREHAFQNMLLFDLLLALPARRGKKASRGKQLGKNYTEAQRLWAHIQRSPLTRVSQITDRERRILVYAHTTGVDA